MQEREREREREREKYKERGHKRGRIREGEVWGELTIRGVGGMWTRRYKGRSRGGTENRKRKRGSGKRGGTEDPVIGKE